MPLHSAYTTSKGAIAALTRSLALDWADRGVRVNCICPGFTRTVMIEPFLQNDVFVNGASHRIPIARFLEPSEVAAAVCFLASSLASAMTGAVIPVDGGWTAGERGWW
jgi:meso-butanediol dehydrogenase / (S,S)-butanediol dehydrogenase / diacetyl reductase